MVILYKGFKKERRIYFAKTIRVLKGVHYITPYINNTPGYPNFDIRGLRATRSRGGDVYIFPWRYCDDEHQLDLLGRCS